MPTIAQEYPRANQPFTKIPAYAKPFFTPRAEDHDAVINISRGTKRNSPQVIAGNFSALQQNFFSAKAKNIADYTPDEIYDALLKLHRLLVPEASNAFRKDSAFALGAAIEEDYVHYDQCLLQMQKDSTAARVSLWQYLNAAILHQFYLVIKYGQKIFPNIMTAKNVAEVQKKIWLAFELQDDSGAEHDSAHLYAHIKKLPLEKLQAGFTALSQQIKASLSEILGKENYNDLVRLAMAEPETWLDEFYVEDQSYEIFQKHLQAVVVFFDLPRNIERNMRQFSHDLWQKLRPENKEDILDIAAWAFMQLVDIHPWTDGQGRVARAMSVLLQMHHRIFPMMPIEEKGAEKKLYVNMVQMQRLGIGVSPLKIFFAEKLESAKQYIAALQAKRKAQPPKTAAPKGSAQGLQMGFLTQPTKNSAGTQTRIPMPSATQQ